MLFFWLLFYFYNAGKEKLQAVLAMKCTFLVVVGKLSVGLVDIIQNGVYFGV